MLLSLLCLSSWTGFHSPVRVWVSVCFHWNVTETNLIRATYCCCCCCCCCWCWVGLVTVSLFAYVKKYIVWIFGKYRIRKRNKSKQQTWKVLQLQMLGPNANLSLLWLISIDSNDSTEIWHTHCVDITNWWSHIKHRNWWSEIIIIWDTQLSWHIQWLTYVHYPDPK